MKKWTLGLVLVVAFSLSALAQSGSTSGTSGTSAGSAGQSDTGTTGKKSKSKSKDTAGSDMSAGGGKSTSVTGCLNGSAGNYTLTNGRYKNGVAVTAASGVDLAPHVGHQVRLTGTWEKGSDSSAAGGTSASKTFNATAMKHISDTCTAGKSGSKTKAKSSGMSGDTASSKS
ncbi:MAG: hypothetical protein JO187_10660, partial [Acidobacteria bacterium]|nr:hypothetical protein [Acidobacteriota bacterium]